MMISIGHRPVVMAVILTFWAGAVGAGTFWTGMLNAQPGRAGNPSARWVTSTGLGLNSTRPNLLIFLHPRCPCSRSSVSELIEIINRVGAKVMARAIVLEPSAGEPSWTPSQLEQSLTAIKGLEIVRDPGGLIAKAFQVETSGHVLLYDPSNRLLFSGGITGPGGHAGGNPARDRLIAAVLEGVESGPKREPCIVFGCPLETPMNGTLGEASSWKTRRP